MSNRRTGYLLAVSGLLILVSSLQQYDDPVAAVGFALLMFTASLLIGGAIGVAAAEYSARRRHPGPTITRPVSVQELNESDDD